MDFIFAMLFGFFKMIGTLVYRLFVYWWLPKSISEDYKKIKEENERNGH